MPWPLPQDPFPPDVVCIQVKVPNDSAYLDAFWGQLLDLATAYNWANDNAHTALLARDRMRQMYMEAADNNCPKIPDIPGGSCGCEMCNQLRFNNCVLEMFDCFTQMWIPVPTVGTCVPDTSPGGGVVPPSAGKCVSFTIEADSHALTPMPFFVNTGDTVQVTAIKGASTDGSGHWYCADGSIFLLGACAGGGFPISGDPLAGTNHAALLWKIGSNYYPLTTSLFTVPSGVVNQPIFIQTNTPSLTNNSGSFNLELTYCNNATPPAMSWCQLLDFTLSPHGASVDTFFNGGACGTPTQPWGQWISGTGLEGTPSTQLDCTHGLSAGRWTIDLGISATITNSIFKGSVDQANPNNACYVQVSNDPTFASGVTTLNNPNVTASGSYNDTAAVTGVGRYLRVFAFCEGGTGSGSAHAVVSSLELKGTGVNPFGTSNC